jgi:hypothetical protein
MQNCQCLYVADSRIFSSFEKLFIFIWKTVDFSNENIVSFFVLLTVNFSFGEFTIVY